MRQTGRSKDVQYSALWDSEIPPDTHPGPTSRAGHSPHLPLLMTELSQNNHLFPAHDCATLPPTAHTPLGLGLPGAHTRLCDISLISPGTAFVFKTEKYQLGHKNAVRSWLLLCWRGGNCSSGHSRHWGLSGGLEHSMILPPPKLWGDSPQGQQLPLCKDSKHRTETSSELRAIEPQNH